MFELYRFKRQYRAMKIASRDESGAWEVTMQDVRNLLDAIPIKTVRTFTQRHVRFLERYNGGVYYATIDDLLDAVRTASSAIRTDTPLGSETLELTNTELATWLQPTQLACNFSLILTEFQRAYGELVDAYNAAPAEKAGYYRRRTFRIVSDVFSLTELLAEMVMAGKTLNA